MTGWDKSIREAAFAAEPPVRRNQTFVSVFYSISSS